MKTESRNSKADRPQLDFVPPDELPGRTYLAALDRRIADTNARKGEIRKLKLMQAAAQVLEKEGYHGMNIADVVKLARVARGTFYIYYDSKTDISRAVFADFSNEMFTSPIDLGENLSWEERIYRANLNFCRIYQLNNGLINAFLQFADLSRDFQDMRSFAEDLWAQRMFRGTCREFGIPFEKAGEMGLMRQIYCMQAMAIRMTHIVYLDKRPNFEDTFTSAHDLAVTVSRIWIETIYSFLDANGWPHESKDMPES